MKDKNDVRSQDNQKKSSSKQNANHNNGSKNEDDVSDNDEPERNSSKMQIAQEMIKRKEKKLKNRSPGEIIESLTKMITKLQSSVINCYSDSEKSDSLTERQINVFLNCVKFRKN